MRNKKLLDKDKFFLIYASCLHYGAKAPNELKGDCKRIYNQFFDAHDHVLYVLCSSKEHQINFLLFCAAEHGEL